MADIRLPESIPEGMALIKMIAAPINPSDLNQIEGLYPVKGQFEDKELVYLDSNQGSGNLHRDNVAIGGNEGVAQILESGKLLSTSQPICKGDWVLPIKSGLYGKQF